MANAVQLRDRVRGALLGIFVGDALAMPVHWYYNPNDIKKDYGGITKYEAPKLEHPSSIMSLSSTGGAGRGGQQGSVVGDVINHGRKELWGRRNVHYHHGMKAGENTLNAVTARLLLRGVTQRGGRYDPKDWLDDYVQFMTTPGSHNDTYAETYHRMFFANFSKGVPPAQCAGDDGHNVASIGGLVTTPVATFAGGAQGDETAAVRAAIAHQMTTHNSKSMQKHTALFAGVLHRVVRGGDLREECARAGREMGVDLPKLVASRAPDEAVVSRLGAACYIDGALANALYFAYKYADDPAAAVLANANAGGENAHRGAAVGALVGAGAGYDAWRPDLRDGLAEAAAITQEIDAFANVCTTAAL